MQRGIRFTKPRTLGAESWKACSILNSVNMSCGVGCSRATPNPHHENPGPLDLSHPEPSKSMFEDVQILRKLQKKLIRQNGACQPPGLMQSPELVWWGKEKKPLQESVPRQALLDRLELRCEHPDLAAPGLAR